MASSEAIERPRADRDAPRRCDTALAFGNAIRNSVSTLGGPASPADLARLLATDFAEEMSARDEILKAADEPAPAPPPRAARSTRPPPLPPQAPAPARAGARRRSEPDGTAKTHPTTGPRQTPQKVGSGSEPALGADHRLR